MIESVALAILLQGASLTLPAKTPAPAVPFPAQADSATVEREKAELEKLRLETDSLGQETQQANLKTWLARASIAQSVFTVLSIIVGGWWVYLKFVRAQEKYPNLEFTADINPIGIQNGMLVVELLAYIENKGKAQHKMASLDFDLNALMPGDALVSDQRWGGQINFPAELCRGSFLPARYKYFFVDPGTKAKYSYVAGVPENAAFLLLHCYFRYSHRDKTGHAAERTIRIQGKGFEPAALASPADGAKEDQEF